MLGNIGTVELLLIMLAVLLVFGAKRIPEIAQGLGKGIREFRSAMREISTELQVEDQQIRRATNVRPPSVRPTPTPDPTGAPEPVVTPRPEPATAAQPAMHSQPASAPTGAPNPASAPQPDPSGHVHV